MSIERGLGNLDSMGDGQDWNMFKGIEGVPFRTKQTDVPLVKRDDPDHMQPQLTHDIKVKTFDTSKPKELKEYTEVLNFCARKLGRIMEKETAYDKSSKSWRIFLTWACYFWQNPSEASQENIKYYK